MAEFSRRLSADEDPEDGSGNCELCSRRFDNFEDLKIFPFCYLNKQKNREQTRVRNDDEDDLQGSRTDKDDLRGSRTGREQTRMNREQTRMIFKVRAQVVGQRGWIICLTKNHQVTSMC